MGRPEIVGRLSALRGVRFLEPNRDKGFLYCGES